MLLRDAEGRTAPFGHDVATLAVLHIYALTLIVIAGRFLAPRGLADARDLTAICLTVRYIPFVVQLIFFARHDSLAYPIALVNVTLFGVESVLLHFWLNAPRSIKEMIASIISISGVSLALPALIREPGAVSDPFLVEAAWLWVACGLASMLWVRRDHEEEGYLDLYGILIHSAALPVLLVAPMAVGLVTARAVVLLPALLALVTLFCHEANRRPELEMYNKFFAFIPGLVAACITCVAWWPPYELAPGVPMAVVLVAWSWLLAAAGRDRSLAFGAPAGGAIRGGRILIANGTISLGWICVVASFLLLVPGIRSSMRGVR